jgi:hypothetical protein
VELQHRQRDRLRCVVHLREVHTDGSARIERRPDDRVRQDRDGVVDVVLDGRQAGLSRQQGPRVCSHHRLGLDVDDAGRRMQAPGDLVHVGCGRQAGPQRDELVDARLRHPPDRLHHEPAGGAHLRRELGVDRHQLRVEVAVDLVVVLAAQREVVDPGRARPLHADGGRRIE